MYTCVWIESGIVFAILSAIFIYGSSWAASYFFTSVKGYTHSFFVLA